MNRNLIVLSFLLLVAALSPDFSGPPPSADNLESRAVSKRPVLQAPVEQPAPRRYFKPTVSGTRPEAVRPKPVEQRPRPVFELSPKPSELQQDPRIEERALSIRDVSLEMGRGHPALRNPKRLQPTGIAPGRWTGKERVATLRADYYGYDVLFDQNGAVCSVSGNGLERNSQPILKAGDTGSDVERLLGWPNSANRNRHLTEWRYRYSGFTLVVKFKAVGSHIPPSLRRP